MEVPNLATAADDMDQYYVQVEAEQRQAKQNATTQMVSTTVTQLMNITELITTTVTPLTTTFLPNVATTISPGAERDSCHELTWIKLALLTAILICLILLVVTVCVSACYYFSTLSNSQRMDLEQQIAKANSPATETIQQIVTRSPALSYPNEFDRRNIAQIEEKNNVTSEIPQASFTLKQLSLTPDKPRPPLASSIETSTFSQNLAPPSPRSVSTGPGMEPSEEAAVKKMALDRIEQEEAKRHMDLAMMADKSSSLARLGDELRAETAAAKVAAAEAANIVQTPSMPFKQMAYKNGKRQYESSKTSKSSQSKQRKKRALTKDAKSGSKDSSARVPTGAGKTSGSSGKDATFVFSGSSNRAGKS